jgi:hypothetical protein
MTQNGWDHGAMTAEQRKQQDALAASGKANTQQVQNNIAQQALVAGGATSAQAKDLTKRSADNLKQQGVKKPSGIPWHK